MPEINVLPKEIYQLIAAGEVVERPSSVVKEMIENSIDAGAKNITAEIQHGGSTYIRITDDGCGIERSQIKKVFTPHATSKISKKDDLTAISTLGFRGEAMASISAVAKIQVITKAKNESVGTQYVIEGSEEISLDDAGCPDGTTVVVRDIFYNTPARMKFLKKDVTEGNSVAGVVDRMAISHPEISFRFIRDGKQTLITSGNGDLMSAIYSVFGKEISQGLTAVDYSYEGMSVSGFVSKPTATRKSRAMQFFFINGRLVKSATAVAALEQAYKDTIMVGRFPMCVLNVTLDPSRVDVNVHPAKIEVRFAEEKPVFNLIYYAVKTAVEADRSVKKADFSAKSDSYNFYENSSKGNKNSDKNDVNIENIKNEKTYSAKIDFFRKKEDSYIQQSFGTNRSVMPNRISAPDQIYIDTEPINNFGKKSNQGSKKIRTADIDIEYSEDEPLPDGDIPPEEQAAAPQEEIEIPNFRVIGEAFETYFIVEIENELYFIDKHAAHERMNYEQFKSQATVETQMLLSPVAVNLSKDEFSVFTENIELVRKCGFEVDEFGESAVIVRAIPSLASGSDVSDLIIETAQKLLEHKTDIEPDKIDWIYHSASCRGAVKAGDYTSQEERELFVKKLLSMPNIRFCPHGRPIFIKISKYDIEKQFGRV